VKAHACLAPRSTGRDMSKRAFQNALWRNGFFPDDTDMLFHHGDYKTKLVFTPVLKASGQIDRRATIQSLARQLERVRTAAAAPVNPNHITAGADPCPV
jgi:hypothetical protein